ncbi:MAG: SRPBCC domain-containing protein [Deltaproteobacteria bacterium]|nr:SRPBCC domain-containing protein [Deltaproteobacteria bacterium]
MQRNPEARIVIDAPAAAVWEVLVQLEKYSEWNPCLQFQGEAIVGSSVPMTVGLFNRSLTVPVVFEVVEKERELRWRGGPSWLMSGSHYFKLRQVHESGAGTATELIQGEAFQGVALPLLWPFLNSELDHLYHDANEAIKQRVESLIA